MANQVLRNFLIAAVTILSTTIGILGVKSFVEVILYAQPMVVRVAKNICAFVADMVVLIAGLPICIWLRSTTWKLIKEEL